MQTVYAFDCQEVGGDAADTGSHLVGNITQLLEISLTGRLLDGGCPTGKSGNQYRDYDGVAIECQGMPDAPNHPNFPSQVLSPGETYRHTIVFALKTI